MITRCLQGPGSRDWTPEAGQTVLLQCNNRYMRCTIPVVKGKMLHCIICQSGAGKDRLTKSIN